MATRSRSLFSPNVGLGGYAMAVLSDSLSMSGQLGQKCYKSCQYANPESRAIHRCGWSNRASSAQFQLEVFFRLAAHPIGSNLSQPLNLPEDDLNRSLSRAAHMSEARGVNLLFAKTRSLKFYNGCCAAHLSDLANLLGEANII